MSDPVTTANLQCLHGVRSGRMLEPEVARRLDIGRLAVYAMLEQGILPRNTGRSAVDHYPHAYEQWERTCGTRAAAGLPTRPEVTVLN